MIRTPCTPGFARVVCGKPWMAVAVGRCGCPNRGVFSLAVSAVDGAVYAGTEPSRLFRSDDRGDSWRELDALLESPLAAELELPTPAVDVARALDRTQPARRRPMLVGIELGGLTRSTDGGEPGRTTPRRPTRRALARLAPTRTRARVRGRRRWGRLQHGRRRDVDASRRGPRPPLHLVDRGRPLGPDCWYLSASTGPYAAHGRRDPQARIYRRRDREPWRPLDGGLPEPLPAMPYALLATGGRLFGGLADGQTLGKPRRRG